MKNSHKRGNPATQIFEGSNTHDSGETLKVKIW